MNARTLCWALLLLVSKLFAQAPSSAGKTNINTVLLPSSSPLVSFRILFNTGSASDPAGKEGLASLTAAMIAKGSSQKLVYDEILKRMYPMAASFDWQVDKEMTVFSGVTHVDTLYNYYALISQMLLTPGFREDDFNRLRTDALNYLRISLREGNDEELGKEALYCSIYEGTPYGHHNMGKISALEKMTVEDVINFYRTNYTRSTLTLGLSGGYPEDFLKKIKADLATLPLGAPAALKLEKPELQPGMQIKIIARETRSTAISIGFPIDVRRGDDDWVALSLVASYFGQHRSSNSYLYQRLRELRGLNYGDYAYIEYFPRGMFQFQPDPNMGRQQQIFQIWLRPVPLGQGLFTLRAALFELNKLTEEGMTQENFEATRQFLSKYVNILTGTEDSRLGYALDSQYYGIPDFVDYVKAGLNKLTLDQVNAAIRKHLKSNSLRVAIVTKDAAALKERILSGKPSPITYNSPKPAETLEEDKLIEKQEIPVKPDAVTVIPVDELFQ
jgi:zinc protease